MAPKDWYKFNISFSKKIDAKTATVGSVYNNKAVLDCPILGMAESCKKKAIA